MQEARKRCIRKLTVTMWGSETNPLVEENHIRAENQEGLCGKSSICKRSFKAGKAFQAEKIA